MNTIILGGGIAGLSLAYFLDEPLIILEKEAALGGLSRSFKLNNIAYDIGPHIIFSKNEEVLDLHIKLIKTNKIKRSNKIFHQGHFIKYPFENDLGSLEQHERNYCLKEFLDNPYENFTHSNMLQFFLKTFGEGITKTYLQPYNEKIWKFDPAYLDTQMVERIPKPPREDVIKSANGTPTEGYAHQLYFHYPKEGGFQTLVNAYVNKIRGKTQIHSSIIIKKIYKTNITWIVETNKGVFQADQLINCMPLHELFKYLECSPEIRSILQQLKYNSIYIVTLQCHKDKIRNNFALYIPSKDIIFHRLSKLNFLGSNYCLDNNASTILIEITYRPNSYLSSLTQEEIQHRVISDLERMGLIEPKDIFDLEIRSFEYAYVIYDINHRKNTDLLLKYLKEQGIHSCGRFAEFEYMNSDQVVESSMRLAKSLKHNTRIA